MNTKQKKHYVAPKIEVHEMKMEQDILTSSAESFSVPSSSENPAWDTEW